MAGMVKIGKVWIDPEKVSAVVPWAIDQGFCDQITVIIDGHKLIATHPSQDAKGEYYTQEGYAEEVVKMVEEGRFPLTTVQVSDATSLGGIPFWGGAGFID